MHEGLLTNKRIIVTGGSRGLGRAFCKTFAQEGASVAFTYSSDDKGAQDVLGEIKSLGRAAVAATPAAGLCFKVSVTDQAGMLETVHSVEKEWGGIDILVNNAGVSRALPVALMDESDWDYVIDTNLKGMYIAVRAVLGGMVRARSGIILNIGSLAGMRIIEAPVHYAASKAAVKGFTEALSKEVSRYCVRVISLAPGLLEDGVANHLPSYKLEEYLKHVALKRLGTFEEVSNCAAFLLSRANTYMNGTTLVMDGGF